MITRINKINEFINMKLVFFYHNALTEIRKKSSHNISNEMYIFCQRKANG